MLSNKWTFSLKILVMLLALALVVVPCTEAHKKKVKAGSNEAETEIDPAHPAPTLSVSAAHDVSSADGAQVMRPASGDSITVQVNFDQIISVTPADATRSAAVGAAAGSLDISDFVIATFDEDGLPVAGLAINAATGSDTSLAVGDPNNGKNAVLTIVFADATTAVWERIDKLIVSVKDSALTNANPALTAAEITHAKSVASNRLTIQLVDADDGNPQYAAYDQAADVAVGTPGVVSITRVLSPTGFDTAETGAFDVRIILTEKPKEFTETQILVDNGTAGAPVAGLTIEVADLTIENAGGSHTSGNLPEPTGNDDMYYQYLVTITPNLDVDGMVVVSVDKFEDQLLPQSKMYIPLLKSQRTSTPSAGTTERDARVMDGREVLSVRVKTGKDTKVTGAKAAYDARQKVFDAVGNEIVLGNKLYIPAGGFLVLVGDRGKAGIADPKSKTKEKLTAAQKLYNVTGLGLPFPADDLDNFFRNGGTLNLAYADIPEATGSGHGDSKGATGDDATGYTAADSTAHAVGALMISEIMWGLDSNGDPVTGSQYIELHNPSTTTAIGIDNKEWVLTAGSAPAGFTVIDTIGNNPATGFWQVPGQGGVSGAEVGTPEDAAGQAEVAAVIATQDLISMSRVAGGTDGTAAASWAASIRPSANLSGRRIGTPGAPNKYMMPEMVEETAEEEPAVVEEPMASVATASDIMVSEIMVASNDGRLPQWIELVSTSAMDLSLAGWSVVIDNSDDDADVHGAGAQIQVDIGDVMVGAGQTVLLVSKEGRNSGIGMGEGDIRADRIVDLSDTLMPESMRYTVLSEMGFTVTLMPPQVGAIRMSGDSVGNLEGGWELPMAESGRSSIVRREMGVDMMAIMGTAEKGWVLASGTALVGAYVSTYYGSDEDVGTPGYDAGGPLPVELSNFYPARDKVTGQVVITWETQSELNNAGFFIKRSEQPDGKFLVINPTMIPGAGTTAEKQSYTHTDTTAKPNVLYYYQIEDVSLDGKRATLTGAHRLRGHIGAAGKVTTIWGELKAQE